MSHSLLSSSVSVSEDYLVRVVKDWRLCLWHGLFCSWLLRLQICHRKTLRHSLRSRVNVPHIIYRHFQGNPNSNGLQLIEVAYWPAIAVGGTVQFEATHQLPERTHFGSAYAGQTNLCPMQQAADNTVGLCKPLWPSPPMFSGNDSLF